MTLKFQGLKLLLMINHFKENQTRIFSYLSMQNEAISVVIKINPLMPGGNKMVTHT